MERARVTVRGEDAWALPRAVADVDAESRFDHEGDGFAVIVLEQYFYRILGSVQTTVVFELVDDGELVATVIAGGGAAGMARDDADAEGTALRQLVDRLRRFCERNDLEFDPD